MGRLARTSVASALTITVGVSGCSTDGGRSANRTDENAPARSSASATVASPSSSATTSDPSVAVSGDSPACGYTYAQFSAMVGSGWKAEDSGVPMLCRFSKRTLTVTVLRIPRTQAQADYIFRDFCEVFSPDAVYLVGKPGQTGPAVCVSDQRVAALTYRDGKLVELTGDPNRLNSSLTKAEQQELIRVGKKLIGA